MKMVINDGGDGGGDGDDGDDGDGGEDEACEEEIRRMCVTRSGICLVWIQLICQTLSRRLEMTIVMMTMMTTMMMKLISLLSELN